MNQTRFLESNKVRVLFNLGDYDLMTVAAVLPDDRCSHCIFAANREGNQYLLSLYPEKNVDPVVIAETAEADVCLVTRQQRQVKMKEMKKQLEEDSKGAVVTLIIIY